MAAASPAAAPQAGDIMVGQLDKERFGYLCCRHEQIIGNESCCLLGCVRQDPDDHNSRSGTNLRVDAKQAQGGCLLFLICELNISEACHRSRTTPTTALCTAGKTDSQCHMISLTFNLLEGV